MPNLSLLINLPFNGLTSYSLEGISPYSNFNYLPTWEIEGKKKKKTMVNLGERKSNQLLSLIQTATLLEFVVSFPNYAFWVVDCVIHGLAYHWFKEPDEEDELKQG